MIRNGWTRICCKDLFWASNLPHIIGQGIGVGSLANTPHIELKISNTAYYHHVRELANIYYLSYDILDCNCYEDVGPPYVMRNGVRR